jgi:hypothetical protein
MPPVRTETHEQMKAVLPTLRAIHHKYAAKVVFSVACRAAASDAAAHDGEEAAGAAAGAREGGVGGGGGGYKPGVWLQSCHV